MDNQTLTPPGPRRAHRFALLLTTALILSTVVGSGCSRTFYRRQADIDAYALVREKATHPHWRLDDYSISVDPRSRMYDPYAIDCPPMPADDPTAHELMHCVDNKRGWPFWHDNGERPFVENPAWPEFIQIDDRGVVRLRADDAVRIALLNSRTYQQQLETLYLSALDVSFERFRFDSQFFAGYSANYAAAGPIRAGVPGGSSLFSLNTARPGNFVRAPWSVNRLFATGSELVVNFANSLVWEFAGSDDYRGQTLIDFALVQPLLRDAGRDRILERLTRAERILLYNVRSMEQYRQGFYLNVITGSNAGQGPSRAGGQFGGAGLENFAGVGAGGFGQVGGGGGAGGGGDTGAAQAGNYLGLLQTQREIRNTEDNVRRLRRNLTRLTTQLEVQPQQTTSEYLNQGLQVAQARQALINSETALLNARNSYQATLDTFKFNVLGLPPQICVEPYDNILDQFELIDADVLRLPEDWESLLIEHIAARREISERIQEHVEVAAGADQVAVCRLQRYPELDDDLTKLRPVLEDFEQFVERIVTERLPMIRQDLDRFRASLPRRRAWIEKLVARIDELRASPCDLLPIAVNPLEGVIGGERAEDLIRRVEQSLAEAESSYEILSGHFNAYAQSLGERGRIVEQLQADKSQTPEQLFEQLVRGVYNPAYVCGETRILTIDIVEDITRELTELQLLQAIARSEAIELQDIDIRADQALEVARRYRRDWMNARGALVDAWRLVQFNADPLQGFLDVFFSGDIANVSDNPFRLRAGNGRLRVGVQFDAPLTRLAERNIYRQALIEYQQARRSYYAFEDGIARGLRATLRTVTTNQINFELQRMAVLQAARQVMLNAFLEQESQRAQTTRVTAARDAVQAISDLLNAQNDFMSFWVNYEVLRLSLDFNLGTMQLDSEGLWIDPGNIGADYGQYDPWLRWQKETHDGLKVEEIGGQTAPHGQRADPIDELPPPFLLPPAGR